MVTLQYVQLLNMHPSPAAVLQGLGICWKFPFWDMGLLLGSHTFGIVEWEWHLGVPHRKIPGN